VPGANGSADRFGFDRSSLVGRDSSRAAQKGVGSDLPRNIGGLTLRHSFPMKKAVTKDRERSECAGWANRPRLAGHSARHHDTDIMIHRVSTIDSHTAGEPTRTVVAGGPDLSSGSLPDRRRRLIQDFDDFRACVVTEPRGSDVLVGSLLCRPTESRFVAGVIFFNNVGALQMCGHGTIGVAVTLAHLGRIGAGRHCLETTVGDVWFELESDLRNVRLQNVPSYRAARDVAVNLPGGETVIGDVAWGGNWFFLTRHDATPIDVGNVEALQIRCREIKTALHGQGVTGDDGGEIDHIELYGPAKSADARNFVLCPGNAWDRSPCGTGTSAKIACLAADGLLKAGEIWRQESVTGTVFEASYEPGDETTDRPVVVPTIRGSAWITAETTLVFDSDDPLTRRPPWWEQRRD